MKRLHSLIILLLMIPGLSYALGLGNLELNSALNEPFDANIKLLSATASELDSLKVELADSDAFDRANLDRPFILSQLRFSLVRPETGDDYIKVISANAIREPFLNFLVEISWANGRLFREYTVLLDPPMYDPKVRAESVPVQVDTIMDLQPAAPEPAVAAPVDPDHQVVYAEDFDNYSSGAATPAASTAGATPLNYSGGDYGPTGASDTLWSIASAMRPDTSISVNQMMLALLSANPDAFLNNNINGLKRGQILAMPSEAEMNAMSSADALAEVKGQYAAWDQIKGRVGTSVAERPDTVSAPTTTPVPADKSATVTAEAEDSELKLVAAGEEAEATGQVASVDGAASADLALAQENIQALTQENLELKDQLQENESIINDLKRLLELKDDELAVLQEQIGEQAAADALTEIEEEIVAEAVETEEEEPAIVEEEPVVVEEEIVAEEVVAEPEAEVIETVEEEVAPPVEETAPAEEVVETIDVIDVEPATADAGIMEMLSPILGPLTDMLGGNPLYAVALLGLLVVLILVAVAMKLKKKPAAKEAAETQATAEAFPEFDTGDEDLDKAEQELESEAATVLPGSEEETAMPEEEVEIPESEDETYLPGGPDEEPAAAPAEEPVMAEMGEEEEEEDPLQEVNTYLAFEQFDQAEEFVRNAINDKPENAEYHTKLLEVFYTSGNKKAYEEEAKVLHDLVSGEGEHWDMAQAMWSEMSPNRALFEAGADEEEEETSDTTGGFVDVTADAEAEEDGLDFDIGAAGGDTVAEESTLAESDEELLDLTAADEGEEDILDVTAAVGLEDTEADTIAEDEEMLDISGGSAGSEDLLDVTAVGSAEESEGLDEDVLDISSTGSGSEDLLESSFAEGDESEDLLDVTAAADLEMDTDEDLLDVTAATGAGADSDELLDLDIQDTVADTEHDTGEGSDNVIDFDLAASGEEPVEQTEDLTLDMPEQSAEAASEGDEGLDLGSSLELDTGEATVAEDADAGLELDLGEGAETDEAAEGLELDLSEAEEAGGADEPIRLDIDMEEEAAEPESGEELSLDIDMDEGTLQETAEAETEAETADTPAMDFDLSIDEGSEAEAEMDGTMELEPPSLEMEDDEDDGDHTVFVPRASQPEEQTAEDEIATKLDLAKAYVELGDKDSAKTILDEVMADGNEEQKQQAQDLLGQV